MSCGCHSPINRPLNTQVPFDMAFAHLQYLLHIQCSLHTFFCLFCLFNLRALMYMYNAVTHIQHCEGLPLKSAMSTHSTNNSKGRRRLSICLFFFSNFFFISLPLHTSYYTLTRTHLQAAISTLLFFNSVEEKQHSKQHRQRLSLPAPLSSHSNNAHFPDANNATQQ
jgi:hypothetical protein